MTINLTTLAAILVMAVATYSTRLIGPWIAGQFTLEGRARVAVEAIPGSVLVAVITPLIASSGTAGILAGLVTALAAARGPLVLAVLAGVSSAALFRHLL